MTVQDWAPRSRRVEIISVIKERRCGGECRNCWNSVGCALVVIRGLETDRVSGKWYVVALIFDQYRFRMSDRVKPSDPFVFSSLFKGTLDLVRYCVVAVDSALHVFN